MSKTFTFHMREFACCALRPFLPSPLAGRGRGWGYDAGRTLALSPLPNPPPQGGREKKLTHAVAHR